MLPKHHLFPFSGHEHLPHIIPHHGAVKYRLTESGLERQGGLEVSKTPRRIAAGHETRTQMNTTWKRFPDILVESRPTNA